MATTKYILWGNPQIQLLTAVFLLLSELLFFGLIGILADNCLGELTKLK